MGDGFEDARVEVLPVDGVDVARVPVGADGVHGLLAQAVSSDCYLRKCATFVTAL